MSTAVLGSDWRPTKRFVNKYREKEVVTKYRYFGHLRRPEYRMVMESGRPFPAGLNTADWQPQDERPYERVHVEVMKDIEQHGYGFFKQNVRIEDLPRA
jgi:hypothetical protein